MRVARFSVLAAALVLGACGAAVAASSSKGGDWPMWGGESGFSHHSPLKLITPANVSQLQPAWSYELGADVSISSPLIAGGRAFLVGGGGAIVALDAATGKEIWKQPGLSSRSVRALTYWASADGKSERIFFSKDNILRALDARTGAPIEGYNVDLRQGVDGRDPSTISQIASNAPGTVFGDLVIFGALTGEDYGSPPGDIRAFDARTGKNVWTFRPLPRDGEKGSETWPKNARATFGGVNNWTGMSLDGKRGILYAVTGSSTFDYWGGDRHGDNLYANCLLAIDARTGKLLWHFQTVHHDIWDYDLPTPPVLLTVNHDGKKIDAVVAAGKVGFLYAFDRVTGKPLWPIEERPVPKSNLEAEGERASPTQPFPTKLQPFGRQKFTVDDLDPALPATERDALVKRLNAARNEGLFTPADKIETVQMPGALGATNWGMLSSDPERGFAYVVSTDMPSIVRLALAQPITATGSTPYERGKSIYAQACTGCHGADRKGNDTAGIPSLVGVTDRVPRGLITSTIMSGRGHMPQFPAIRASLMSDMLAYLSENVAAPNDPNAGPDIANPANPPVPRWRSDYGLMTSPTTRNPIIKPPWSQVTAYDLNTGDVVWRRPIGNDKAYTGKIDGPTGLFGRVGSALTASGLMFVATGRDQTLHALDAKTGKTLWTGRLPAQATGLPSIYEAGGREFVLVPAASGPGDSGERGRNAFVAFALPEKAQ